MSMLILGFSGETEQEGTSRYIKGGLLQALAHQESWGCKSQSVSKGLRTKDFDVPGQEKWMPQLQRRQQTALSPPFVLLGPRWVGEAHLEEGSASLSLLFKY